MTVQQTITQKLTIALQPLHLDVINESGSHHVPAGSETHFKLVIASLRFEGQSRVQRHRRVYDILAEELAGGVHALAIHTYTPEEWQGSQAVPASPDCLGGSKPAHGRETQA